ncbi:Bcr/CflA family efflux MFS transporter [Arthrobacter sp. zg-Y1171]|uniref:Bcr/CflA family efflux MFS transporter n=1 Tax=Arthrobacter sp. zg-Y1171 TaxID=2964610 RepID=UPI0021037BA9|nr:Bcr/CflA family efflux MFS transporter [Arthrobacter sp. zg-Y1171]MCQ1996441.1 Bcr/CflA family efflux MFS transporter [Arthrobacter sp. zg-Y1171]UWX82521.1 Bcr/CflA family efflux MFS transporter [Arthrobacter sp. zg-Y1171]
MSDTPPKNGTRNRTATRTSIKYILMLGALAALPAVTTDMYLPALPEVAEDLHTSAAAAQFTLSGTLLGAAVGQLVIGPFSDRFGRRLPLIIGIALHVVVSLLCFLAPNIGALIVLRLLQGFFNAAAGVVALAVVRDRFTGSSAAAMLSRLMLIIGLAPLLAPSIGQAVSGLWNWRAVFLALALIGVVLGAIVLKWMPETLPPERRRTKGGASTFSGFRVLLKDRQFLALATIPGLGMAVIMSYVVGSPFVFQDEYGLSPAQYAAVFAINGVGMVISAQLNAWLVGRYSPMGILRLAVVLLLGLTVLLPVIVLTGFGGAAGLTAGLWLVLAMHGFIASNSSILALNDYGHMAGSAAALIGALQVGLAGIISPLVGILGGGAMAMVSVIIGCAALIVLILATATTAYRGGGSNRPGRRRLRSGAAEPAAPSEPGAPLATES